MYWEEWYLGVLLDSELSLIFFINVMHFIKFILLSSIIRYSRFSKSLQGLICLSLRDAMPVIAIPSVVEGEAIQ